jgi:hypothetical protein
MQKSDNQKQLAIPIQKLLDSLRRRTRLYVFWEGMFQTLIWLGLVFWITLIADRLIEPNRILRGVLLILTVYWTYILVNARLIFRLRRPLSDSEMAAVLERRFPELDEAFLTCVEMIVAVDDRSPLRQGIEQELASLKSPEEDAWSGDTSRSDMLSLCHARAVDSASAIDIRHCFNIRPIYKSGIGAAFFLLTIAILGLWKPDALAMWSDRLLLLSDAPWPRRTSLEIEGFDENGVAKIARGDNFPLIVHADLHAPHIPRKVTTYAATPAGRLDPIRLEQEGVPSDASDRLTFVHDFLGVVESLTLDVVGGDVTVRDLRIIPVERPSIPRAELECRYPTYMNRPPSSIPLLDLTAVPHGSLTSLQAIADKDLMEAIVRCETFETRLTPKPSDKAFRELHCEIPITILGEHLVEIELLDVDGIRTREPLQYLIRSIDDDTPKIAFTFPGIGTAVTPNAEIPVQGEATDDYGVNRVWLEMRITPPPLAVDANGIPVLERTVDFLIDEPSDPASVITIDERRDLQNLQLKPGMTLDVRLLASDLYDLENELHVGRGDIRRLDVVTPERLLAILRTREVGLRQQLVQVVDEVGTTRESCEQIIFETESSEEESRDLETPPHADISPLDPIFERRLWLQRVRRDLQKESNDIKTIALAFLDIRDQLVNNRVGTLEQRRRIEQDIVGPLNEVRSVMIADLERDLSDFDDVIANENLGPARRDDALRRIDDIDQALKIILSRIKDIESYNEMIEQLRTIIEEQRRLRREIEEEQRSSLLDLLGG